MLDFYDPDITERLNALEEEEEELLKMEGLQDEVMEEHESGIGMAELQDSLKEVRGKKAIAKMNHKLKAKNRVHARQHNLTEMIDDLESKGIKVNKESLRSRSKSRRTIADIEAG